MTDSNTKTAPSPETRRASRGKKWAFRVAAMLLGPAVFLALLEGGLRVFGYGYETDFFVKVQGPEAYRTNPRFGWRFFPRSVSRTPVAEYLPADKGDRTVRIFILGGSAAAGTPEPAYNFGRILRVMLAERFPETRFEVVNAAMTAINSHVALQIARDCAERDPDLFIVYMGNNEVIGPFGAGSVFRGYSPSLGAIRAGLWLKTTRVGQLAADVAGAFRDDPAGAEWRGMEVFLDRQVAADDERLAKVYDHFRQNLRDIRVAAEGAGAKTVLCTVAVNLKDCAPLASAHRAGLADTDKARWERAYREGTDHEQAGRHEAAVQRFLEAAKIDDRHAGLHFRLGRCYGALKRFGEARASFARARDLDALRFRADSRLNEIIREVAAEGGATLVDAVKALADCPRTPNGIPGEELFHEHVHLRFAGNWELARAVFDKVVPLLPDSVRSGAATRVASPPASIDRCRERLALTGPDEYRMALQIWDTTSRPPFVNQLDYAAWRARAYARLRQLRRYDAKAPKRQAALIHAKAVAADPSDLHLRRNYAALLGEIDRSDEAIEHWRFILERMATDTHARFNLAAALLATGNVSDAQAHLKKVLQYSHQPVEHRNVIGRIWANNGRLDEALAHFRAAVAEAPGHAPSHSNLGDAYFRMKRYDRAIEEFAEAARLRPQYADHRHNLGQALLTAGRLEEAVEAYREAVRLEPYHVAARERLGFTLLRLGRAARAVEVFADALRRDPGNPLLERRIAQARERLPNTATRPAGAIRRP